MQENSDIRKSQYRGYKNENEIKVNNLEDLKELAKLEIIKNEKAKNIVELEELN